MSEPVGTTDAQEATGIEEPIDAADDGAGSAATGDAPANAASDAPANATGQAAADAAGDAAGESTNESTVSVGDPAAPRVYDFQRPAGMADQTRQVLELGFEEIASSLQGWLGAQIREQIDVSIELLEEARFGLFRRELARPCSVFLLGIEGSAEAGLLEIDAELAFRILERTLGSEVDQIHIPERPLTWIERSVLREVVSQACEIMSRAWKEHIPLTLSVFGFESVPEMLSQSNQDSMLQARVRIEGEEWMTSLTLLLPAPVVSGALAKRQEARPALDPAVEAQNRRRIAAAIQGADLQVSVRLPTFPVSLRQISSLELGGLVSSDLEADTEVEVYVSDELRFTGRIGRQGEHLAVEILKAIQPGDVRSDSP